MNDMLKRELTSLPGIGAKRAGLFLKLGISDLKSLIEFFPRTYEDRTSFLTIRELSDGVTASVRAEVVRAPFRQRARSGMSMLRVTAHDDTGTLYITFFNANYLNISEGNYIFYGKIRKNGSRAEMINPYFEPDTEESRSGRIVPIYRLTEGLTSRMIASCVEMALEHVTLEDILPSELRERYSLCHTDYAYRNIHMPADAASLEIARRRLVFEEFLTFTIALSVIRGMRPAQEPAPLNECSLYDFTSNLPFELTGAQKRCVEEIYADLTDPTKPPMRRLVQGDVGSGKTVVAAAAVYVAMKSERQAVLMVPTEILAYQHYADLEPLFRALGIEVYLLTGGMSAKERKVTLEAAASGRAALFVATHAAFSENVEFPYLSLVITDEQHRFGVRQRVALASKGEKVHVLIMSATPIPRTLALMLYGDLDLSMLDELPPGRTPIDTRYVTEVKRENVYMFMRRLFSRGRQGYVVCPLIDDGGDENESRKSVEKYADELKRSVFPEFNVEILHGRMKSEQKDDIMRRFTSGEITLLVSTTVIEVGVNVPNAAIMVIENCERFGLSQLHQLRGRVGRGNHKSYCVLFSQSESEDTKRRIEAMCNTNDGFKIAEADLALRGPGDLLGERQSGLPAMRLATLGSDIELMTSASAEAKRILSEDPKLTSPGHRLLREYVEGMIEKIDNR